jgi:hypothetical protein
VEEEKTIKGRREERLGGRRSDRALGEGRGREEE